ncbi:MAG: lysophospholipid acyltransferase family protein [Acidobacteriota bacterium]
MVKSLLVPILLQVQRVVIFVVFKTLLFLKIRNARYIPRSGPAIIAPNHQTRMDALPLGYRVPQPVFCAVDRDYFHKPFIGWWLRTFRGVPLGDRRDREGYQRCLEVIRGGNRLILFPEGSLTRDGKLRKIQPGAARAALTHGVDIVPATLVGAFEIWPRHRPYPKLFKPLVIKFYPPIRCEVVTDKVELKQRIAEINEQLERIMKRRLAAWARLKERRGKG